MRVEGDREIEDEREQLEGNSRKAGDHRAQSLTSGLNVVRQMTRSEERPRETVSKRRDVKLLKTYKQLLSIAKHQQMTQGEEVGGGRFELD